MVAWIVHLRPFADLGQHDHGGVFYPKAIKHLFVGVYTMEISLLALFLLVRDARGQATCICHAVLSVLALALVAVYHSVIHQMYGPLLNYLPTSLERTAKGTGNVVHTRFEFPTNGTLLRLPQDSQGLSRRELDNCSNLSPGVITSLQDATIDERGRIQLVQCRLE